MIKKAIAYSFILLSAIILLAHNVIPHHHHHDDEDAIEYSGCLSSNVEKEHIHDFPEHNHPKGECLCAIHHIVIVLPNLGRLTDNDDDYNKNNGLDCLCTLIPDFLSIYSPPYLTFPFREKHINVQTTVRYTFGLRAPPVS
jgi:hypothetical protein